MNKSQREDPKTFTDFLRRIFKNIIDAIASFFIRLGIKPNAITWSGLIGNIIAGLLMAFGHLFWGGLLMMIVVPLDALDGTMARMLKEDGKYGSLVDSVTDRFSEIAILGGLLIYLTRTSTWQDALLVFFATTGSIMVSYVRAKAEALGFSAKIGIMTRAERYIILVLGILLGYPKISLWIMAILGNFTAIQRFWHVRKQAKEL